MSGKLSELEIFISSPSDVVEERRIIDEVANSINNAEGKIRNFFLRIVGSQTTIPGPGDAQDWINKTLEDVDLVIGIFRRRFGSPTKNYESGTLEELFQAIENWKKTRKPWVMIYFLGCDEVEREILNLNPKARDQFAKVLQFRKQLEEERIVFYKCYKNIDEFCDELREHLVLWSGMVDDVSERLVEQLKPFLIPKATRDRAKYALTNAEREFIALNKKFGSAGQDKALEFIHRYDWQGLDGQYTVMDSNKYLEFHAFMKELKKRYKNRPHYSDMFEDKQLFDKFKPILDSIIERKTGQENWVDWLSSDEVWVRDAKRSGIKVERCDNWMRFNAIIFTYFEPWGWYLLVEVHNEVPELDIETVKDIIKYLKKDGWYIIEGHYPHRSSSQPRGMFLWAILRRFLIFRKEEPVEIKVYDDIDL